MIQAQQQRESTKKRLMNGGFTISTVEQNLHNKSTNSIEIDHILDQNLAFDQSGGHISHHHMDEAGEQDPDSRSSHIHYDYKSSSHLVES